MTPAELREIGEKLYGSQWQTKLARELPVDPRTVRKWLAGKRTIRPVIAGRIRGLLATNQVHSGEAPITGRR